MKTENETILFGTRILLMDSFANILPQKHCQFYLKQVQWPSTKNNLNIKLIRGWPLLTSLYSGTGPEKIIQIFYDWCTAFSGRPTPKPWIFTSCGRSKVGHWTSRAISIYWWPAHMLATPGFCVFFLQRLISLIFPIAL